MEAKDGNVTCSERSEYHRALGLRRSRLACTRLVLGCSDYVYLLHVGISSPYRVQQAILLPVVFSPLYPFRVRLNQVSFFIVRLLPLKNASSGLGFIVAIVADAVIIKDGQIRRCAKEVANRRALLLEVFRTRMLRCTTY